MPKMPQNWNDVKSGAKKVKETTQKGVKQVRKRRRIYNEVKQDGIAGYANKKVKEFIKKTMAKLSKKAIKAAAKSFFSFLVSNPLGWITAVAIVILIGMMGNATTDRKTSLLSTSQSQHANSVLTKNQFVALSSGCITNTAASSGSTARRAVVNGANNWSKDDVAKFATNSIKSTFGISDDKIEEYVLGRSPAAIVKYGLNKSNIRDVTNAVKDARVSPVIFYLYTINEGGGAGGFINHYGSDTGSGAVADAKRDAQYLAEWANKGGGKPATEESTMPGLPTSAAQTFLNSLGIGTLGRVYLQATAAVTGEIEELSGNYKTSFNKPLEELMTSITSSALGGDLNAGTMIGGSTVGGTNCNRTGNTTLVSGGMNLQQAQEFMLNYYNTAITESDFPGAVAGTPDIHDNCTTFSSWFVHKFTNLKSASGDGSQVVSQLASANGMKEADSPQAYAVFSIAPGKPHSAERTGHTGIILGVDTSRGKVIVGQANYGWAFTKIDDAGSGVNAREYDISEVTKDKGWSFLTLNRNMKSDVA